VSICSSAKHLWMILDRRQASNECCWPSQDCLAKDLGVASLKHVRKLLKELEREGIIEIQRTGLNRTNLYRVLVRFSLEQKQSHEVDLQPVRIAPSAAAEIHAAPCRASEPLGTRAVARQPKQAPREESETTKSTHSAHGERFADACLGLQNFGLSASVAGHFARRDLDLAIKGLAYASVRFKDPHKKPIANEAGFIRSLLKKPLDYGFEKDADGSWRPPPESQKACPDRHKLSSQEYAIQYLYQQHSAQWDELSSEEKSRIKGIVEKEMPLWSFDEHRLKTKCLEILRLETLSAYGKKIKSR
jgi:hypothetical protein